MTFDQFIDNVQEFAKKADIAVTKLLEAHPEVDQTLAAAATAAVADVKTAVAAPVEKEADALADKVAPTFAPELVPVLNGLIEKGIAAAQAEADAEIAKLTAVKAAIAPVTA